MARTEFYKSYGAQAREDKCVKISAKKYLIVYGYYEDPENADQHYTLHGYYDHQPSKEELRSDIEYQINSVCDKKILTDLVWNEKPVYLSSENQFNFKAAFDLAYQTEGANLPIKLKLGEYEDGSPAYHTFKSINALKDFYSACINHIQSTIQKAWDEKDSVDYSAFDELHDF